MMISRNFTIIKYYLSFDPARNQTSSLLANHVIIKHQDYFSFCFHDLHSSEEFNLGISEECITFRYPLN